MKDTRIKVIQLIPEISDAGAEMVVSTYLLSLDKCKFNVFCVTSLGIDAKSANAIRLTQKGIKIYAPFVLKISLFKKILNKIQRLIIPKSKHEAYRIFYLKHLILQIQPDVIHVHMHMLKYLMPIADKLTGTKIFYTCHSFPNRYFNETTYKDELFAARYLLQNNNLQMIALHTDMQKQLNNLFGINNTIVVNNPINLSLFRNVRQPKSIIRQQLGIPSNAYVVGHVGRFCDIKNQSFLVDVFRYILQANNNAFLFMIGAGDKDEIIEKIHLYDMENHYLILSNREDVNILMHAMDVFVFPSLFEGMGLAVIEAQAAGLPCIMSSTVPSQAVVSIHAIQMHLSDGPNKWADKVINEELKGEPQTDITSFDGINVMREVEQLYGAR